MKLFILRKQRENKDGGTINGFRLGYQGANDFAENYSSAKARNLKSDIRRLNCVFPKILKIS